MKSLISICIYVLLLHVQVSVLAQENWSLEKDKEGIKIYTKYVSGSDFKIFKTETTVKCSIDDIIKALKDVGSYTKWVADCKKAELLKADNLNQYHYIETLLPLAF